VGKFILRYLWLITFLTLHRKTLPLTAAALQAFYRVVRLGEQVGVPQTLINEFARLTAELSESEVNELKRFFDQIGDNQALIHHLTPGEVERFNRSMVDREGVRYGSVVAGAPPPPGLLRRLLPPWRFPLLPPDSVIYAIFSFLHEKSAPHSPELRIPARTAQQDGVLQEAFGKKFDAFSDGIVPSRSQVWGTVLHAAAADHLDITGHFDQAPRYVSWLKSGSRFGEEHFHALWERVIDFTAGWQPAQT
jgi:hypothetical protein